jgi:hypothetical protein
MWMPVALVALATVAILRLFRAAWDRTRLLVILAMAAGWLLLAVPGVDWLVRAGGRPVVELVRQAGYVLSPFALLAGAGWGLARLARRCWAAWPELGTAWRGAGVVGCLAVGLLIAVLVRSTPGVAEATQVAERATVAGARAGWTAAWEVVVNLAGGGDDAA